MAELKKNEAYERELEYLVDYAETTLVYFIPLWDGAEKAAGEGSSKEQVKAVALEMIGDMIDRGLIVGNLGPNEGDGFIPWNVSRDEVIRRVAEGIDFYEDETDFVHICWFGFPEQPDPA